MDSFAAIDFETANSSRSSICSVGVVIVREGKIVEKDYHLICPIPNSYSFWNTKVHGLTFTDTNSAPYFPTIWNKLASKIGDLPLVAHNCSFDESCLKSVFSVYDLPYPDYTFYCTLKASRRCIPNLANYQLQTVAEHCGYHLENHHHALADAEACAIIALEVFK